MIVRRTYQQGSSTIARRRACVPLRAMSDEALFQWEMVREQERINRARRGRFAVLTTDVQWQTDGGEFAGLLEQWAEQLRMTDSIGAINGCAAVLLPDTDRDGARCVASRVEAISDANGCQPNILVWVYPDDDPVATKADELAGESSWNEKSSGSDGLNEERAPWQHVESLSNSAGDSEISESAIDSTGVSRTDGPHAMRARGGGIVRRERPDRKIDFTPIHAPGTPWWKRLTDMVGSAVGLVLLSPLFAIAALAIWWEDGGPVLFRQKREGLGGREFEMYKFRTMRVDAEAIQAELRENSEQDGPAFKMSADPRVTRVGRFLRKSCVDELPQLLNVLRGDMSLVGPRPLPVHESTACRVWQRRRLDVLPGLTCIWQVYGGRETPFEEWMRMDLRYIRQRSFWFDLKLIFRTALLALMQRGSV